MASRWSLPSRSRPRPATHVQGGMQTQLVLSPTLHSSRSAGLCWEIPQHHTLTSRSTTGMKSCSTGSWEVFAPTQISPFNSNLLTSSLCGRSTRETPGSLWRSRCSLDGGSQFSALSAAVAPTQLVLAAPWSLVTPHDPGSSWGSARDLQKMLWGTMPIGWSSDTGTPTTGSTSNVQEHQFLAHGSPCHTSLDRL